MKRELRDRWIAALTDGSYQQGQGHLRYVRQLDGTPLYCCLGVLCDIIDPNGWSDIMGAHRLGHGLLSPRAAEKHGLPWDWAAALAGMNDRGASFIDIAKEIETYLPAED